jgi:hypothetical protein
MKKLSINFIGFWPKFNKTNNIFYDILSKRYDVSISSSPDILFCSNKIKTNIQKISGPKKIYYSAENKNINSDIYDFTISSDYSDNNSHYRLPNWARLGMEYYWKTDDDLFKFYKKNREANYEKILNNKKSFCNFIYSNGRANFPGVRKRNILFNELSKYKKIDAPGRVFNNINKLPKEVGGYNKINFMNSYKFTIAFENSSRPGYTTEKLLHAFLSNTIPIYWGNELAHKDFNSKSFINYHEFDSIDKIIDLIVEIDNDKNLFLEYISSGFFNEIPSCAKRKKLEAFLIKAIEA